jgi:tRNA(fMet)-specific endonuclease VapC
VNYLLDTNILVHCIRGDATWQLVHEEFQLLLIEPKPLISIVSEAELRSLALLFNWGKSKLDQMEYIVGYFDEVAIDSHELVEVYSTIDAHFQKQGIILGKNDLWIASTAVVQDAVLLTTDRDYDALDPLFLKRELVNVTR